MELRFGPLLVHCLSEAVLLCCNESMRRVPTDERLHVQLLQLWHRALGGAHTGKEPFKIVTHLFAVWVLVNLQGWMHLNRTKFGTEAALTVAKLRTEGRSLRLP